MRNARVGKPKKLAPKRKQVVVNPVTPSAEQVGKTCSICGTGILQSDTVVACPVCSLPYHHDCWKEIRGCGTYGCSAAPIATMKEATPEDIFSPGWTAEKKCPECGSNIIANALVCKVCKANFPVSRPMTKAEWKDREYDGKELERVKYVVVIQFLFSAIGCLVIFMLPINILTAFTDNWTFRAKRLPPVLKVLFYASFAISIIWATIAVLFILYSMTL